LSLGRVRRTKEWRDVRKKPWLYAPSVVKLLTNPWPITEAAAPAIIARDAFMLADCRRSLLVPVDPYKTPLSSRLYTYLHRDESTPVRLLAASKNPFFGVWPRVHPHLGYIKSGAYEGGANMRLKGHAHWWDIVGYRVVLVARMYKPAAQLIY
jgi:hypothetical protein